jgi:hypothetical protein
VTVDFILSSNAASADTQVGVGAGANTLFGFANTDTTANQEVSKANIVLKIVPIATTRALTDTPATDPTSGSGITGAGLQLPDVQALIDQIDKTLKDQASKPEQKEFVNKLNLAKNLLMQGRWREAASALGSLLQKPSLGK